MSSSAVTPSTSATWRRRRKCHLTGEDRVVWLARLEAEDDNLRAALDWAERTGDADTGLRTAAAIWRFWQQRGHLSEGRARLERLLAMPSGRGSRPAPRACAGRPWWHRLLAERQR